MSLKNIGPFFKPFKFPGGGIVEFSQVKKRNNGLRNLYCLRLQWVCFWNVRFSAIWCISMIREAIERELLQSWIFRATPSPPGLSLFGAKTRFLSVPIKTSFSWLSHETMQQLMAKGSVNTAVNSIGVEKTRERKKKEETSGHVGGLLLEKMGTSTYPAPSSWSGFGDPFVGRGLNLLCMSACSILNVGRITAIQSELCCF